MPLASKTTTILSLFSGRSANRLAATTAAPEEIPARMPSSFIKRLHIAIVSSLLTCSTSSIILRSRLPGMKPAPIPWILCGPGVNSSPALACVITGLSAGSTATTVIALPAVFLI